MRLSNTILVFVVALALACSDDSSNNDTANNTSTNNGSTDAGSTNNATTSNATTNNGSTDAGPTDAGDSGSEVVCTQATIDGLWELTWADDVSVEYSADVAPDVEGESRQLSLLFERYSPVPDVGTFDLSEGPRDNFGTCPQCAFIRTDGPERAYFQAEGTLESGVDPYGRRIDFTISGLKLVEVEVDGNTRSSTPIPNGRCIEFAEFSAQGVFPPDSWTCSPQKYNDDETCDCACGAVDPDCGIQQCALGDTTCDMEPTELPVVGCDPDQVCTFDPATFANECKEPCDWEQRDGCSNGTCVFGQAFGQDDICVTNPLRVAPDLQVGDDCPDTVFQIVCNVSDGFAQGYCGPNGVCRGLCTSDDDCTEDGHTCRSFNFEDPLGYCGPVPVDPEG